MKISSKTSLVLAGVAIVGVAATGVLSFLAGRKTADIPKEELKNHWKELAPSAATCALTVTAVAASHAVNAKIIATTVAVAAAYAKKNYDTNAAVRKLGDDAAKKVKSFFNESRAIEASKNVPALKAIDKNDGKMLCFESESEQYFRASTEQLLWAELMINKAFYNTGEVTLNQFLKLLPGTHTVDFGDKYGWCTCDSEGAWDFNWSFYRGQPWIDIQTVIQEIDGREVMVLNYGMRPMENLDYEKMEE